MEYYKIPISLSFGQISYDPLLDELLDNPSKFIFNNENEKLLAKNGNYLKLEKKIFGYNFIMRILPDVIS